MALLDIKIAKKVEHLKKKKNFFDKVSQHKQFILKNVENTCNNSNIDKA